MIDSNIKPMGRLLSLFFFGVPAVLLYLATHLCIPFLHQLSSLPVAVCWYICGGLMVFVPLFFASLLLYRQESRARKWSEILARFRLQAPDHRQIISAIVAILLVAVMTWLLMEGGKMIIPGFSVNPSFMAMNPLRPGEMWILAAWLPLFFFNIAGEAFYWRGYIFPRQEVAFGKHTWLYHGAGWTIFHLAFGISLLVTLLPIIFITSFVVQKTRSTWPDIIIHSFINGSGFIMVAFGLVS